MFNKNTETAITEDNKKISEIEQKIIDIGIEIMSLVKNIMSYQKTIEVLDGDTYLSDMARVQRSKIYPLIEKRDILIAEYNELIAYNKSIALSRTPCRCETREWIAIQIRTLTFGD